MKTNVRERLKNQKGFTLIEVVVVLVIIAILATLMIGALNGYIDMARERQAMSDCRSVVVAGNAVGAEAYAGGDTTRPKTRISDLSGVNADNFLIEYNSNFEVTRVYCRNAGVYARYTAAGVNGNTEPVIEIVSTYGTRDNLEVFFLNTPPSNIDSGEEEYTPQW